MKIQCSCGMKYSFEVRPEMAARPIRFVCQACGLDSSDAVNELIRQQFGTVEAPVAKVQAPPAAPKPRTPIRIAAPAPGTRRAAPLTTAPAVTSGSPLKVQAPAPPASVEADSARVM